MPQIIAGILKHISEITLFLNTAEDSYRRFGGFKAPRYISWSAQNRSQLIRIPAAAGEYRRAELRSPDPMCNPYLAFALLIWAGLDGIAQDTAASACGQRESVRRAGRGRRALRNAARNACAGKGSRAQQRAGGRAFAARDHRQLRALKQPRAIFAKGGKAHGAAGALLQRAAGICI